MQRREFLNLLAIAAAAGATLDSKQLLAADKPATFYDVSTFGNVHFLHMTDCHAQLKPIYFREPSVNLGYNSALNLAPHLVGEHLLKAFNVPRGSRDTYAFTYIDFEAAAKAYGKVGGFAHMATLVKQLKASRPM